MKRILENKKIIVFDGVCALCNKFVLFVVKNDVKNVFRFISLQNKKTIKELNERGLSKQAFESILLIDKSSVKTESSAIISIFKDLRFPYNLLCIGAIFPQFFRNSIYRYIARNRYETFGKINHCSIINESQYIEIDNKLIK